MQHTLRSSETGQVQQLMATENAQVDAGQLMAVVIPLVEDD